MTTADEMFDAAHKSVRDAVTWTRSALSVLDYPPAGPLDPADALARRHMLNTLRQVWDMLDVVLRERSLCRAAVAEFERQAAKVESAP